MFVDLNRLDRGLIFLDEDLTSRNGELTLTMKDGSRVIYDLAGGNRKPMATVEAVGFNPTIKGIRSVPDNTTDIVYEATDEIIRVAYSGDYHGSNTWQNVFVEFPGGLKRYPAKVSIIDTQILAENPNAQWSEFNPYVEAVWFRMKVGQAMLIRFEYQTDPQPLNTGGGKGVTETTPAVIEGN